MLHTKPEEFAAATLKHDKELHIATASSRDAKRWSNVTMRLSQLVERLSHTVRTAETVDQYIKLPKAEQDNIKDVGGFVGGVLKGGRRGKANVANRQVLTLDADFAGSDTVPRIRKALGDVAYTIYSTHKHRPESPRLRLVVYPDRPLHSDEYQALMRKIAAKVGIDDFDDSTYEVNRLMYWPSSPKDGEFLFEHNDAPMVPVDAMLAEYGDEEAWKDTTLWPVSSRETRDLERMLKKQADPLTKAGVVGAFCRVVSIYEAAEEHIDAYRREGRDRYTYVDGSTTKGVVIYDGKFAYSNHSTDPAYGQTCNAFDLVRLHRFGHLDADAAHGTNSTKLPSYKEMVEYARGIPEVKRELVASNLEIDADAFDVFGDTEEFDALEAEDDREWFTALQLDANDEIKTTFVNALMIVENDARISGRMRLNELSMLIERAHDNREWGAVDSYAVREYVGKRYSVDFPEQKIEQAIERRAYQNRYHPVRDYLMGLAWDGVERLDTLFVDFLGCEDNPYTREAAACTMKAAVYRVFEPGTKFDTVPVLGGPQGIGKSSFVKVLAGGDHWFGEMSSYDPKIAMEEISGKWLVELNELGANNKHDLEQQKAFLSATSTRVRMAYAKHSTQFQRQCVFFGTTNQSEYLKDSTGNRRWWPIVCGDAPIDLDRLSNERDQLWAEAVERYMVGDTILLSDEARRIAEEQQEDKREADPWEGIIGAWLLQDAPCDRYDIIDGFRGEGAPERRDRVCVMEIWEDCLEMRGDPKPADRRRIASIVDRMPGWERPKSPPSFGARFGRQKGWRNEMPF